MVLKKSLFLIVGLIIALCGISSRVDALVLLEDDFEGAGIDPVKWMERIDWTTAAPPYPSGNGQDIVGGRLHQYSSNHAVELLSQGTFPVTDVHISLDIEIPADESNTNYT